MGGFDVVRLLWETKVLDMEMETYKVAMRLAL